MGLPIKSRMQSVLGQEGQEGQERAEAERVALLRQMQAAVSSFPDRARTRAKLGTATAPAQQTDDACSHIVSTCCIHSASWCPPDGVGTMGGAQMTSRRMEGQPPSEPITAADSDPADVRLAPMKLTSMEGGGRPGLTSDPCFIAEQGRALCCIGSSTLAGERARAV